MVGGAHGQVPRHSFSARPTQMSSHSTLQQNESAAHTQVWQAPLSHIGPSCGAQQLLLDRKDAAETTGPYTPSQVTTMTGPIGSQRPLRRGGRRCHPCITVDRNLVMIPFRAVASVASRRYPQSVSVRTTLISRRLKTVLGVDDRTVTTPV